MLSDRYLCLQIPSLVLTETITPQIKQQNGVQLLLSKQQPSTCCTVLFHTFARMWPCLPLDCPKSRLTIPMIAMSSAGILPDEYRALITVVLHSALRAYYKWTSILCWYSGFQPHINSINACSFNLSPLTPSITIQTSNRVIIMSPIAKQLSVIFFLVSSAMGQSRTQTGFCAEAEGVAPYCSFEAGTTVCTLYHNLIIIYNFLTQLPMYPYSRLSASSIMARTIYMLWILPT